MMWKRTLLALLLAVLPSPALACSLCANIRQTPTFRQEARSKTARLVLLGTLSDPRLKGSTPGAGVTTFHVTAALKVDPTLEAKHRKKAGDAIELPLYVPVPDPKKPPRLLIFCDVFQDRYDPYRGVPVNSEQAADYMKGALALDPGDVTTSLLFFFRYLENADREIAQDAFMEFAKATDAEIGKLTGKLDASRLRKWLKDESTRPERLGLYSYLLSASGDQEDANLLKAMLDRPTERTSNAYDGILGGYIHLRPKEGWQLAISLLANGKVDVSLRLSIVRTLRFYHALNNKAHQEPIVKALETILAQGELADLAIEDLRRWQMWEQTRAVLGLWSRKGLDAPVMKRAILRYALSSPRPEARQFVAQQRKVDPDLVSEVEDGLKFEKP